MNLCQGLPFNFSWLILETLNLALAYHVEVIALISLAEDVIPSGKHLRREVVH
jgi:hypothetical protein